MMNLCLTPSPCAKAKATGGDIKVFKKMTGLRKLAVLAFMLTAALTISAEGMNESAYNYHSASQVNGDKAGVEWRALTDTVANRTCLQVKVPGYGEYLIEPAWATRLLGKFVSAKADSTGRILVSVELDKYGQKLTRQFISRDNFWLDGIAGQAVAWTEVSFDNGKEEYRTVEDYQLLTSTDAKHYFSFNEEYQRPKFEPVETAQSAFGAPDFSKQETASADGNTGFRIRGGMSKAERMAAKARTAPKKGHSRVTNRRFING